MARKCPFGWLRDAIWTLKKKVAIMTFGKSSVRFTLQGVHVISHQTSVICPVADDQNGGFSRTTVLDTTPWKTKRAPDKLPSSQTKIFDYVSFKECKECKLSTCDTDHCTVRCILFICKWVYISDIHTFTSMYYILYIIQIYIYIYISHQEIRKRL